MKRMLLFWLCSVWVLPINPLKAIPEVTTSQIRRHYAEQAFKNWPAFQTKNFQRRALMPRLKETTIQKNIPSKEDDKKRSRRLLGLGTGCLVLAFLLLLVVDYFEIFIGFLLVAALGILGIVLLIMSLVLYLKNLAKNESTPTGSQRWWSLISGGMAILPWIIAQAAMGGVGSRAVQTSFIPLLGIIFGIVAVAANLTFLIQQQRENRKQDNWASILGLALGFLSIGLALFL